MYRCTDMNSTSFSMMGKNFSTQHSEIFFSNFISHIAPYGASHRDAQPLNFQEVIRARLNSRKGSSRFKE